MVQDLGLEVGAALVHVLRFTALQLFAAVADDSGELADGVIDFEASQNDAPFWPDAS